MSSEPDDTMQERISTSALQFWLVLKVSRWVLIAVILGLVFLLLVTASTIGLSSFRAVVSSSNAIHWIFSAFIGAIITGTTIVVTINQLVLSQELGAVGDQRERMHDAMAYRQDVEEVLGEGTSPPDPAEFLHALLEGVEERAVAIGSRVEDHREDELGNDIERYIHSVVDNTRSVQEGLDGAQFGTFDVLRNALDFNYSWKIYRARQLRDEHAESLSAETLDEIDGLIEVLTFFAPAREHFKTLYFQWALIDLARTLLYIAIPALTVVATMLMYVDATTLPGTTLGVDNLVWLTSGGFVVGIAPFVVFIVLVLRIVTVAKRTLAMGPFILRETNGEDEFSE